MPASSVLICKVCCGTWHSLRGAFSRKKSLKPWPTNKLLRFGSRKCHLRLVEIESRHMCWCDFIQYSKRYKFNSCSVSHFAATTTTVDDSLRMLNCRRNEIERIIRLQLRRRLEWIQCLSFLRDCQFYCVLCIWCIFKWTDQCSSDQGIGISQVRYYRNDWSLAGTINFNNGKCDWELQYHRNTFLRVFADSPFISSGLGRGNRFPHHLSMAFWRLRVACKLLVYNRAIKPTTNGGMWVWVVQAAGGGFRCRRGWRTELSI